MLPEKLDLEIVTPERRVLAETVDEVVLPGMEGYLGVRPGHAPLLTSLAVGEISYRSGRDQHFLAVTGGFVEVLRDRVSILATAAERAEEIDLDRAERARERAQQELARASESDFQRLEVKLKRAITRINVHGKRQRV